MTEQSNKREPRVWDRVAILSPSGRITNVTEDEKLVESIAEAK